MRLIDANNLFKQTCNTPLYDNQDEDIFLDLILVNEEIDPVHAANACYCKECWYYTEWGECKEFGDIMKPDDFCSRGKIKNV